ncbi:MAG: DHH family phosphoesterase [bacterium]|nr:DHH family phosphoesterase [bacterium]
MNQQPVDITKLVGQIRDVLTKQESGIIAIPANPTPDAIAAATALYMALLKMGKNMSIVASVIPQSDLPGADKIKTSVTTGGDNLIVSFPYEDGTIDKVDYNIEGNRFNLVIVPRQGSNKLEPNDIQFSYTGGKVDFIITIDTPNLRSLGDIYAKNESMFSGKNIINIDRHLINNSFGTINLVSKSSSSTSELVMDVIQGLKIDLDKDMATNLYAGIQAATNNLTAYSVNAETYESVATLLRAGAQKRAMQPVQRAPFPQRQNFGPQSYYQQPPMVPIDFDQDPFIQPQPFQQPQPMFQKSAMTNQASIDQVEKLSKPKEFETNNSTQENPLKPKIFSGSGGLM